MILTTEQRAAVTCDSNTLVEACPGSGKTRSIVAKILRCLDDVRNTPRKIAVITYTNAAVYEIESRLRVYGATDDLDSCEISTIHSFCLNNILHGFYWRTRDYRGGFKLLPPETEEYQAIVRRICGELGLLAIAREEFPQLNRGADGEPILHPASLITRQAAHQFWRELADIQAIDFATVIYLTNRLLEHSPSLAHALSCRFRWILVDEFQDTTELQIEILKKIYDASHSNFFLVGDPHQSIFGFAGARPKLVSEFSEYANARTDFQLSENWRSNPQIVAHAELLRPRAVPMRSAGAIAADQREPLYIHRANLFEALEDFFLPALQELDIAYGNAAILAPSWFALFPIGRRLRNYGIPIIGPGARPYRGRQLFARLAEYICAYIERRDPTLIRNISRELHRIVLEVSRINRQQLFGYSGRVTIFKLLAIGEALRNQGDSAERWLVSAGHEFGQLLVADQVLPKTAENLLSESAAAMCDQMRANRDVDLANMTVSDLGLFAATGKSMHLLTMHAAKGLEFEAVALVSLHDGQIPNFRANSAEDIDEARRLMYVAITRAKRLLLYITDQERPRNIPSRFLGPEGLRLVN